MIYLETKVHPNRSIFVFWRPFCIQNGRHSKPKWSPLNIHFHWNLFIFEFFTIYFDFILAAILKIFKTKSTTLTVDIETAKTLNLTQRWVTTLWDLGISK
jgi:hypothetical protein